MLTVNKKIACTPFETTQTRVEVKGGLPMLKQKQELSKLQVVLTTEDHFYRAGDSILVRGDACKLQFAKEVYEEGDKTFILIPYDVVVAIIRPEGDDERW